MPAPVSSATYDAANRVETFDGFVVDDDANGNITAIDGDTYEWNVRDELVSITGPNLSASFGYDAVGRRSTKTINGQTTHYLADGINPLQEQASAGGPWTALTMTGAGVDEIIARGDASGTYYFLPDGLGSTVALTDGAGAVHTEYTYAPFGETTRTGTVSTNPFQFTGRENDNTGLYHYRARYYHPVLQRFISEDPIGFAGGYVNLYAYVGNDPVNYTDPTGTEFFLFGRIPPFIRTARLPQHYTPPRPGQSCPLKGEAPQPVLRPAFEPAPGPGELIPEPPFGSLARIFKDFADLLDELFGGGSGSSSGTSSGVAPLSLPGAPDDII